MNNNHSVESHLGLDIAEYDRIIRTFIPGYDTMLNTILDHLKGVLQEDTTIIDLGGGTGSLACAIAEKFLTVQIELWDIDQKMLAVAKQRLSKYGKRVRLVKKSFHETLPSCNAVVASLSLHHINNMQSKTKLYSNIYNALEPSGIFLNGDATIPLDKNLRSATYGVWTEFMKSNSMTEDEVQRHFNDWSKEDTYFSLPEELSALTSAGFPHPECVWKNGPMTVFGGSK